MLIKNYAKQRPGYGTGKELLRKDKALAEAAALLMLRGKVQCPLGQQRGRLTPLPERQKIINLVSEAVSSGARKHKPASVLVFQSEHFNVGCRVVWFMQIREQVHQGVPRGINCQKQKD